MKSEYTVALAGNPNVGKSTVFNALTHLRQHTGNWPGKTVSGAVGRFDAGDVHVKLVDVPGAYSLVPHSPEEAVARDYILGKLTDSGRSPPDAVAVVLDACCMERSLRFASEIAKTGLPCIFLINLTDEAEKRGIAVNVPLIEELSGIPSVSCCAVGGTGLPRFTERLADLLKDGTYRVADFSHEELFSRCVTENAGSDRSDRLLDRIFTGRITAMPAAALLTTLLFFLTLKGSSPVSEGLSHLFSLLLGYVSDLFRILQIPEVIRSLLCDGVLSVTFTVTAVMLPPMAIFFPLFTLLEDFGYLPRVAYCFDRCFKGCHACGKQALTMMMALGCNAAGVTGCRIIDSPRERLIAILTNSFVPCNGRLAIIVSFTAVLSSIIGRDVGAVVVCAVFAVSMVLTFSVSGLLSATLLRGQESSFTLELPPYRVPRAGQVIVRSVLDRTVFVLGRALAVAAPAGAVIWLLTYVKVGGVSLLSVFARFLEPVGRIMGLDGVTLCAFILAFPAAELILPLILLGYSGLAPVSGNVSAILSANGWSSVTVVCAVVFTLVHFPCSTTVLTVKKETGSVKWAILSAAIPTVIGFLLCVAINALSTI